MAHWWFGLVRLEFESGYPLSNNPGFIFRESNSENPNHQTPRPKINNQPSLYLTKPPLSPPQQPKNAKKKNALQLKGSQAIPFL